MANDAATRVEKASHDGGTEAAYEAFTAEVEQISSNSNYADADQKILELTGALQKKGLLPELETYWALQQDDLFGGDDKFSRSELDSYVEGKRYDAVSYAIGNALKADYGRIKDNVTTFGADVFGNNQLMFKHDLEKNQELDTAKRFADELKANPELYDVLSGPDGNAGSLSWVDINKVRESIDINSKMGKQVFSDKQIDLIKRLNWDTFKGLSGTWFDVCPEDLQKMPAFNPGAPLLETSSDEAASEAEKAAKAKAEADKGADGSQDGAKAKSKSGGAEAGKSAGKKLGEAVGEKLGESLESVGSFEPTLMKEGSVPPEDHIYKYEIQAGQGFDRIARDILRRETANAKDGQKRQYDERDVIALSEAIAKFNGMKRDDMLRLDKGVLNIPPLDWTAAK